eukprot:CAMPEP_0118716048 /NCGR_PEP_ID=MMETSP0800-20121206/27273_1 /TAXON_ID=210618 ORGANISM="Striatella unipunctata, Strain CCMP2910" /NCGR_SAMPLE_ID=MMETSP0800 /ASSEMBLY_ACC=CAM_ASM_000638 /LENGTH=168 /DNA_ID=CAMNT_0006622403 /DNA_START=292 /DNA_END=798 /DNA_ORIENTATION=-
MTLARRITGSAFTTLRKVLRNGAVRLQFDRLWRLFASPLDTSQSSPTMDDLACLKGLASPSPLATTGSECEGVLSQLEESNTWESFFVSLKQEPLFSALLTLRRNDDDLVHIIHLKQEESLLVIDEKQSIQYMEFMSRESNSVERDRKHQRVAQVISNFVRHWMWKNL